MIDLAAGICGSARGLQLIASAKSLRRNVAAAMVALGVSAFSWSAEAQRVALVRPADGDPILVETFNRLTAELRLQDFEVIVVETPNEVKQPVTLATVAKRADALAGVALVRYQGRTAVDVWFDDRASGVRRVEPEGGTELPNVLAIRAVDLLRVTLREFANEKPQEPIRVDRATSAEVVKPSPTFRPWEFRAEGVAIYDGPHLGAAFGAGLGFARRISAPIRVGILVSGPLVGASWKTDEGTAVVRHHLGWVELRTSWWRPERFDFGLTLAFGAHYLTAHGATPKPPLQSQNDQVWSLAGAFGIDGSFRLTSNASLALATRAVGLTPRPGVGVGTNVAVVESPLLSASAGFLVDF